MEREKKQFEAKVIGKWIKGVIFKQAMLSLDFINNDTEPKYYDLPVRMAFWNAAKVGDKITVTMELKSDKFWYLI